eukprot:356031-Chlamydomonas_euryale.AAC.4
MYNAVRKCQPREQGVEFGVDRSVTVPAWGSARHAKRLWQMTWRAALRAIRFAIACLPATLEQGKLQDGVSQRATIAAVHIPPEPEP